MGYTLNNHSGGAETEHPLRQHRSNLGLNQKTGFLNSHELSAEAKIVYTGERRTRSTVEIILKFVPKFILKLLLKISLKILHLILQINHPSCTSPTSLSHSALLSSRLLRHAETSTIFRHVVYNLPSHFYFPYFQGRIQADNIQAPVPDEAIPKIGCKINDFACFCKKVYYEKFQRIVAPCILQKCKPEVLNQHESVV
jgi:hypothetical protein